MARLLGVEIRKERTVRNKYEKYITKTPMIVRRIECKIFRIFHAEIPVL